MLKLKNIKWNLCGCHSGYEISSIYSIINAQRNWWGDTQGGPFLLGYITNSTTEKVTPIVGIGLRNEDVLPWLTEQLELKYGL